MKIELVINKGHDSIYDAFDKIYGQHENEDEDTEWTEEGFYLHDGVYFSKNPPIMTRYKSKEKDEKIEFDTETDFIAMPYETDTAFIFKGEKPDKIEYKGQANYGAAISFKVDQPGYITICMEDD